VRIALVGPGYPPTLGGIETVVAQQARALSRAGHAVEVFAQERRPEAVGTDTDRSDGATVTVHRFHATGPHNYPVAPTLWRRLAAESARFEVVHAHSYHTLTGLAAALRSRVPVVFSPHYHGTGHSPLRAALHRVYKPLGRAAFGRATAVVCVSRVEVGLVAAHFPAVTGKTEVVPNAVDTAAIRAALPLQGEPPTVLCVGRMERYKRIDRIVHAFAEPAATQEPGSARPESAQLVLIGDGPDRARLEALAKAAEAAHGGVIRFLGRVGDGDLYRWLRTCRVLCSMSEHEAFGLAPAEALAAGARALLSDIPAHAELAAAYPAVVTLTGAHEDAAALAGHLRAALVAPLPPPSRLPDWDDIAERLAAVYGRAAGLRAERTRRTGAAA
jgi:glycosyltransferase involved in cell wall biosynthesis